ncbi:hypothetical protein Tco_1262666 [Tanacetum coccineum]
MCARAPARAPIVQERMKDKKKAKNDQKTEETVGKKRQRVKSKLEISRNHTTAYAISRHSQNFCQRKEPKNSKTNYKSKGPLLSRSSLCFLLEIFSDVTPSDTKSDRTLFGGVTDWYPEPRSWLSLLFQFHLIRLRRVWGHLLDELFGTIPTTIPDTTPSVIPPTTHIDTTLIPTVSPTIPPSLDYIPASPDYSPVSNTEFDLSKDPSSDHIPLLPATSPFLSSTDNYSDRDIPDTPPSPTHGTPFTKTTLSTQSSHLITLLQIIFLRRILRGIHHQVHHQRLLRILLRMLLSDSASSPSSYNHSLPTPSSSMRLSHHFCSFVSSIHRSSAAISERPSHDSSSMSPSRKRSRSPTASVSLSLPTLRALSYVGADLLPSPKRIRSPETTTDLEGCLEDSFKPYVPREAGLGVDFEDESSESSRHRGTDLEMDVDVVRSDGIDPEIQAEINECIAYADALRDRGIDARIVVEAIDQEEIETSIRDPVKDRVDRVTHAVGHRIVATGQQSADMLERIRELERDNMRLRDMMDVVSQRVARSRRRELSVQREMRQIWRYRFYDRMRIARLKALPGGIWATVLRLFL